MSNEFYLGVCTYIHNKFSAKIYPTHRYVYDDVPEKRNCHVIPEHSRVELFPTKEGDRGNPQVNWQYPFFVNSDGNVPDLGGVYCFEYKEDDSTAKEKYGVKYVNDSDYKELIHLTKECTLDTILEEGKLFLKHRSLREIFIEIEQYVYGPFKVEKIDWEKDRREYKHLLKPDEECFKRYTSENFEGRKGKDPDIITVEYKRMLKEGDCTEYNRNIRRQIIRYDPKEEDGGLCDYLPPQERTKYILRKMFSDCEVINNKTIFEQLYTTLSSKSPHLSELDGMRLDALKENIGDALEYLKSKDELLVTIAKESKTQEILKPIIDERIEEICSEKYQQEIEKRKQELSEKQELLENVKKEYDIEQEKVNKIKAVFETYAPQISELDNTFTKVKENIVEQFAMFQSFLGFKQENALFPEACSIKKTDDKKISQEMILENEQQFIIRWKSIAEEMGLLETDDWNTLLLWHIALKSFSVLHVPSSDWIQSWIRALGYDFIRVARITVCGGWIDESDWLGSLCQSDTNTCLTPIEVVQSMTLEKESLGIIGFLHAGRSLPDLYMLPVFSNLREGGGWNVAQDKGNPVFIQQTSGLRWFITSCDNPMMQEDLSADFWRYATRINLRENCEPSKIDSLRVVKQTDHEKVVSRSAWQSWIRKDLTDENMKKLKPLFKSLNEELLKQNRSFPEVIKEDIVTFVANALDYWEIGDAFNLAKKFRYDPWNKATQLPEEKK